MAANKSNIVYPDLSYQIMGAIFEIHKRLGAGFLESVYQKGLIEELLGREMNIGTEKVIDLTYKDKKIGTHRPDLVIEDKVVVELKTAESFSIHHQAQVTSYLKASGYKLEFWLISQRGR